MTNEAKILIASNGSIIVSDYGTGISISTNGGENWDDISHGLPTTYISTLALDSNSVLWVGTNVGIFNSTNFGKNWSEKLTGDSIKFVTTISIDLHGHIFAGFYESGIIRSTDKGKSWTRLNNDLPWGTYRTIFITKKNVLLTSPFWGEGVFRSIDDGESWSRVGFENPTRFAWSFVELPDGELLSFSYGIGLQRSTNNGLSWQPTNAVIPADMTFERMQLDEYGNIYAGGSTNNGLAKSSDNGTTWERSNFPISSAYNAVALAYSSSLGILCGSNKGIFYSTNQGKEWKISKFTRGYIAKLLTNSQNDIFAITTYGSFKSTDLGITWIETLLLPDFIESDDDILSHSGKDIFRSTDKGNSWISLGSFDPITSPVVSNSNGIIFSSTIYYGYPGVPFRSSGLIRSTDNGNSWKLMVNDFRPSIINFNPSGIFFASNGSSLYKTSDNQTWSPTSNGLIGNINCIAFDYDDRSYIATTSGLYISTDAGDSWVSLNLDGKNISSTTINRDGILFAISDSNVYKSIDMGLQWFIITTGLPKTNLNSSIITSNGYIFVGTVNHGVFRSKEITTIVSKNKNNVVGFSLLQNYPNPFNPSTTISFSIPHTSFVSLKLFNSLGQEVENLLNDKLELGYYSIPWNAQNFSSGIYFYRLQSDKFTETKKLLLLK